jgi:urease accessory protein
MSSTSISACEAGCGRLRIIRECGARRSVASEVYAASPLRLLTPMNHGRAAWIYTSTFGGGLVDGDRVSLDVDVDAGAAAFLSTQASTKVYRSLRGTSSELRARVADEALLVAAPDPVVCFAASRYRQVQRFDLSPRASLVAIDWMSSGRRAAGERWAFHEYVAQLSVHIGGMLVVHDVLALRADDGDLAMRMGRFEVLAVAVVVNVGAQAADIVSRVGRVPIARRADQLVAASMIGECGCVVRIAGRSVEQVGRTLRDLLAFVPALLGDDPWSRKW